MNVVLNTQKTKQREPQFVSQCHLFYLSIYLSNRTLFGYLAFVIAVPEIGNFGRGLVSHQIFLQDFLQSFGSSKAEPTKASGILRSKELPFGGNGEESVGNHDCCKV
jgi:hypothetical protein